MANTTDNEWYKRYIELSNKFYDLKPVSEGDWPVAYARLQSKIDRQRKALDALNRKVLSQRFRLRLAELIGKSVSKEEYLAAKAELEASLADRLVDWEEITV